MLALPVFSLASLVSQSSGFCEVNYTREMAANFYLQKYRHFNVDVIKPLYLTSNSQGVGGGG